MGAGMGDSGRAQPDVLFSGVRVFDGVSASLSEPSNVLVRGNTITAVSAQPVPAGAGEERTVIDGAGRVLMPGLIDAHYHAAFATLSLAALQTADPGYIQIQAAAAAGEALLRGFTTVRDVGGPVFGLKRAIDEGITAGPRIYPSGAFISQTSGHGDFRMISELPRGVCGHLAYSEIIGAAVIADGVPDEDAIPLPGPGQRAQQLLIVEGTDRAYALAKKHEVKLAWGTDTLFDAGLASRQGKQLAKMSRWFTAAEVLRMATSQNAALLAMSGERNPYPGKLGVVAAGALADLLLVDGDPLAALNLIATPATSLVVIMKDGKVYKNLL